MKNWFNKNYKTLIIAAFLVPIITVAIVSISHVTTWYGISNPVTWSVYLSIGIEIAALSALAAISANMGSKVYFPFAIVTLVQFIGNIFFAYTYIDIDSKSFKDWVDLVSPLVEYLGVEPTDFVGHKRFLAFFAGGMLPVISLSFLHMLVKFTEEDKKKQDQSPIEEEKVEEKVDTIDASDLVGEVSRLRLSEEDLKKLEEVLLNPPPPNENLVNAFKKYEEQKIEQEKIKAASLKEEWALNDEEILKRAEEIKYRQILEKAEELRKEREEIYGPDDDEEEPTALANSQYTEKLDIELVEEEEEEIVQPTKEKQAELLSEMMRNDEELGLYNESLFPEKVEESKKIIENSNLEEVLEQYHQDSVVEGETVLPTPEQKEVFVNVNLDSFENKSDFNVDVAIQQEENVVEVPVEETPVINEVTEPLETPIVPQSTPIVFEETVEKKNPL